MHLHYSKTWNGFNSSHISPCTTLIFILTKHIPTTKQCMSAGQFRILKCAHKKRVVTELVLVGKINRRVWVPQVSNLSIVFTFSPLNCPTPLFSIYDRSFFKWETDRQVAFKFLPRPTQQCHSSHFKIFFWDINWFVNALFCRGFSSLPQPLALPSGPIAPRIPATNEPLITLQSCGGCLFNMYGRNFFFKTYWRSSLASSPVLRICNHIALAGEEC